jgi:hypothetical protein
VSDTPHTELLTSGSQAAVGRRDFDLSRPTAATKLALEWMSTARTLPWHCTQEEVVEEEEEE